MAKRKTDSQIRAEIKMHSDTMRELSQQSHEIHKEALRADSVTEHAQIMRRVMEIQRLSIKESKQVIHLEKIPQNRQRKAMEKQKLLIADMIETLP